MSRSCFDRRVLQWGILKVFGNSSTSQVQGDGINHCGVPVCLEIDFSPHAENEDTETPITPTISVKSSDVCVKDTSGNHLYYEIVEGYCKALNLIISLLDSSNNEAKASCVG